MRGIAQPARRTSGLCAICSIILVLLIPAYGLCATQGATPSVSPAPSASPITDPCMTYDSKFRDRCYELRLKVDEVNAKQKLATLAYNQSAQAVNIRLGEAQLTRAPWIFAVVVLVLCAGLAMAWLQFLKSLRSTNLPDMKPEDPAYNSFKISLQGVEVQSATVGVAILVISLVFFYLYLTIVYQLRTS